MRLATVLPAVAVLVFTQASADSYPSKSIRIVTAEAGGGSDFVSRLIAPALGSGLGQQVLVDNRVGLIVPQVVSKSPADGYTLLLLGAALWLPPFMRDSVPYQVSDFLPVSLLTKAPNILVVHPQLPVKSVDELIALARSRPGELNFGTSGTGNSVHIAGELFRVMAAVQIVRINYKGAGRALTELCAGAVHMMFGVPGSVGPYVKAGRLTALAVTTPERSILAPGLPTVAAAVPGYESVSYLAIFAPAGTPQPVVARLHDEIARALARQDVKERLFIAGLEASPTTPDELAAIVRSDMKKTGEFLRTAGIRAE
jgi:tripartite-type tricarboxylate transporter receptor subunit TctC